MIGVLRRLSRYRPHAVVETAAAAEGRLGLLAQVAATWCVLAALDLALNLTLPESEGRSGLPLPARLAAVCADLAGLTLALLAAVGAGLLVGPVGRRLPLPAPVRAVLLGRRPVLVWVLVLGYVASWGMYGVVGKFLDAEGVAFWLAQPIQIFYWVDPYLAAALLVASIGLAWTLATWLPRRVARIEPSSQQEFVRFTGALVLLALVGALLGELTMGRRLSPLVLEPPYLSLRDDRAGPFAHVLGQVAGSLRREPDAMARLDTIGIKRRPLVPMASYLRTVDRERVKRWNVVVIIVESLRANQLRAYGARRDVMPAVDALAGEARVYANAYTQASHSSYASPVPVSSHYPLRTRRTYTYPKDFPYPRVMMYDVLKPLDYGTGIFSSQNEHWEGMINYLQTAGLDRFFHPEVFKGPTYTMEGDTGFSSWVKSTKHAGSVDDHFTIDEAIRWVDERKEQPFFIALNLQNSHLPYVVPDGFPRRFGPAQPGFSVAFGMWPRDKAPVVKDLYADSLAYVDTQIERLLRHLRARGLWDRTVIVVTGDHGQAFYEHGFSAHASALFDEVMRVPLIIRAPGLSPGIDRRPAQHVDIAPSVFDLLGLLPHPSFQGMSLIRGPQDPNRSLYMVVQTPLAHQYALVRGPYKLIFDVRGGRYLLFDLSSDPEERSDLAPSRPDLLEALANRLLAWRDAQVDYYARPARYTREYPPVLDD